LRRELDGSRRFLLEWKIRLGFIPSLVTGATRLGKACASGEIRPTYRDDERRCRRTARFAAPALRLFEL
jgi:hypothetical protein